MGFGDREMERLADALRKNPDGPHYAELYAAQQALKWATEPQGFAAPSDKLLQTGRNSEAVMGTLAGPAGCSGEGHPSES